MTESSPEKIKKGPFPQYPEGSDMPGVRLILEAMDAFSRKSKIRVKNPDGSFTRKSSRPDALRRTRRELMGVLGEFPSVREVPKVGKSEHEKAAIKQTNDFVREKRRKLISEGHARDQLAEEFISNQQEVRVDMGELGEQIARFVVLTPPEGRKTEEAEGRPPIFLISGISNDLESMGMLPQEIAFKGRKVITIAYPESWHGNVTDEFGKAAEQSSTFEPHVSFFKQAIENIREMPDVKSKLGEHAQIELWGYSAGALMVPEMLTDDDFSKKVSNAAIIAPASNFDQTMNQAKRNVLRDQFDTYFSDFRNVAKMNPSFRGKIEVTADFRDRQERTFNALAKKVLRKFAWWEQDMKVADGGKIAVVSYANDIQTQTLRVDKEISQNPNLHLIRLFGTHEAPKIEPETLINAVNQVFA